MNKEQKEFLKLIEDTFNVSEKDHKGILKKYRQSRNNVKQFIANLYMDYGVDGSIDYAELQKYNRMNKLEEMLKEQGREIVKEERKILPAVLATAYAATYYKSAYQIEQTIQVGINFKLLKPEFVKEAVNFDWSGVPFSQRIWDNQDKLVKSLRTEIVRGIRDGESIDKVSRRINKQFNAKAYESQRLARTETARVIQQAQDKIYKDSGVLEQVQYLATLEENTCEECEDLDQEVYGIDENKPSIPRHPNCRCTYIPYFGNYQNEKRKDNETKEIIANVSYSKWAKDKGIN
ncbi:minor capsid protein [Paraliobacillus sp. X-1268]|uniref:minor capsid protein n=1 Tax=Paraliobacillus sp. X-1268 TaxID=2213193 RepID=UPI00130041D5|nr:minor capsid protein [Paraliobacillus sp. X-1268]